MSERKTIHRVFWEWDFEKEERWLNEMAMNGWALEKAYFATYIFAPCEPGEYIFRMEMNGAPVSSGMGTCGLVGQIGVYTGWVNDVASGAKAAVTGMDWLGLVLISFVLPAVLTWLIAIPLRKWGWIKDGDLKLDL